MGGLFGKSSNQQTKPEQKVSLSNFVKAIVDSSYQGPESMVERVQYSRVPRQIPQTSSSSTYTGFNYSRPSTETIRESYTPKETQLPARTEPRVYSNYESSKTTEYKLTPAQVSSSYSNKRENKVQPPDFVPYEGCLGRWVPANQFLGKGSSFGFYKCESCHKTWMSARSKKEFKQACKACNKYYFPAYLWLNDSRNYEKKEKALVDNLKNHRSDLCEACQKGSCLLNRSSPYTVSRTTNQEREYSYYDDD